MAQGKVLWFNPMKGFGSIVGEDGVTVFVKVDGLRGDLERSWMQGLESGLPVRYEVAKDIDSGELFAVGVEKLEQAPAKKRERPRRDPKLVPPELGPPQWPMRALWTDLGKLGARRAMLREESYRRRVFEKTSEYLGLSGEKADGFFRAAQAALKGGPPALLKAIEPHLSKSERHDWFREHVALWSHYLRPRRRAPKARGGSIARRITALRRSLGRSFRNLEKEGILARPNFTCCGSCASAELGGLVERDRAKGGVYWHEQDEARLRESGEVDLGYVPGTLTTAEVGLAAVSALEKAGLKVEWSGNPGEKIHVSP